MLQYRFTNTKPLAMPTIFLNYSYEELYKLDRDYAIEKEKLKGRDLKLYDRDIKLFKEKLQQEKEWLMEYVLERTNNIKSFKFCFNKYNGYDIRYKNKTIRTFNYLKSMYIDILLTY